MTVRVPPKNHETLKLFAKLSTKQFEQLTEQLEKISSSPASLSDPKLYQISDLKFPDFRKLSDTLLSLCFVRDQFGMETSQFVALAISDLDGSEAFKSVEDQLLLPILSDRLNAVMSLDGSFAITAKGLSLSTDEDRVFQRARVLTEIRPVFSENPEKEPCTTLIVNTLKIIFHQSGDHKEFFVTLDSEQLSQLKSAIIRAEQKIESVKRLLEKSQISYLEIKSE
jgi:hypothetical protein